MINFLVAIDVILAILIISAVFLHQGSDGFMGETTQTIQTEVKFETFDKIIGSFVIAFFVVTLLINYLTIYHEKGTADIDDIVNRAEMTQKLKKAEKSEAAKTPAKTSEKSSESEAPLAQ